MRRRRQSGQAIVLVAVAMVALLTMVAMLLAIGTAYTDRRNLQGVADAAALAAALKIGPPNCTPTLRANAFSEASRVVGLALGAGSESAGYPTGACAGGYTDQWTFGGYTATFSYPYNSNSNQIMVRLVHTDYVKAFASFISPDQFNVAGRAVAQFRSGTPNGNFAIFARTQVSCQGSTTVYVAGSVYSNGAPSGNGGCVIDSTAVKDSSGNFLDFGNFISYADTQPAGFPTSTHFQADGYQLSGHTSPSCGNATTQYLSGAQTGNPSPCASGSPPPAPNLGYPSFPDPNTSYPNGTPAAPKYASPWTSCTANAPHTGPDAAGYYHFSPGCYDTLSAPGKSILDPGFYYLGYDSAGAGICANKNQVLGQDITLEVVNGDMNESNCGNTSQACNGCSFGAPSPGVSDGAATYTYFAAPDSSSSWCAGTCPLRGLLVYKPVGSAAATFNVKGPSASAYLKGTIFWPSTCVYHSNATGDTQGQFVCDTIETQGGSGNSSGVTFAGGAVNQATVEAALVE